MNPIISRLPICNAWSTEKTTHVYILKKMQTDLFFQAGRQAGLPVVSLRRNCKLIPVLVVMLEGHITAEAGRGGEGRGGAGWGGVGTSGVGWGREQ